jgi:hypothetical protein
MIDNKYHQFGSFYGRPTAMIETAENRRHSRSGLGLPIFWAAIGGKTSFYKE